MLHGHGCQVFECQRVSDMGTFKKSDTGKTPIFCRCAWIYIHSHVCDEQSTKQIRPEFKKMSSHLLHNLVFVCCIQKL